MRDYRIILAAATTLGFLLGALPISAQDSQGKPSGDPAPWYSPSRYNPLKLIKRSPQSANDQLAADGDLQKKLTTQLQAQGFLAVDQDLQDVCSDFRKLSECVAVLRLSHTLPVDFSCLKWDVTGVKPKRVADSCAGPSDGKAMRLDRAVELLKPNADARTEAKNALEKAHNDIKDASS